MQVEGIRPFNTHTGGLSSINSSGGGAPIRRGQFPPRHHFRDDSEVDEPPKSADLRNQPARTGPPPRNFFREWIRNTWTENPTLPRAPTFSGGQL